MHISNDYQAKLLADARMKDFRRWSANQRVVSELRMKYRRQLILWLGYVVHRAGKSLVSWGERMQGTRVAADRRGYLAGADAG